MDFNGCQSNTMDFNGFLMVSMGSNGFLFIAIDSKRYVLQYSLLKVLKSLVANLGLVAILPPNLFIFRDTLYAKHPCYINRCTRACALLCRLAWQTSANKRLAVHVLRIQCFGYP